MGQWVGAQGRPKTVKIFKICPLCDVTSRKSPPKPKIVFSDFDYKTCWIRRGFEQLSSSIAWRVIVLQSSTRKVAHAGLKGLWTNTLAVQVCNSVRGLKSQTGSPHVARLHRAMVAAFQSPLNLGELSRRVHEQVGKGTNTKHACRYSILWLPFQNLFQLPSTWVTFLVVTARWIIWM